MQVNIAAKFLTKLFIKCVFKKVCNPFFAELSFLMYDHCTNANFKIDTVVQMYN